MFRLNRPKSTISDEMRLVRERSVAESWPLNDPRAEYPAAVQWRRDRNRTAGDADDRA